MPLRELVPFLRAPPNPFDSNFSSKCISSCCYVLLYVCFCRRILVEGPPLHEGDVRACKCMRVMCKCADVHNLPSCDPSATLTKSVRRALHPLKRHNWRPCMDPERGVWQDHNQFHFGSSLSKAATYTGQGSARLLNGFELGPKLQPSEFLFLVPMFKGTPVSMPRNYSQPRRSSCIERWATQTVGTTTSRRQNVKPSRKE